MLETPARRAEGRSKRRGRGLVVLFILVLLVGGAAVAGAVFYSRATGASGPKKAVQVRVPAGATGAEVAELLERKGIIRSALAFRLLAKFRGVSSAFQAGRYRFTTNMTVAEALTALEAEPLVVTTSVTIPEGYTVAKTADRVAKALNVDPKRFVAAATSGRFSLPPYLPEGSDTVEGFLFPSTYEFVKNATSGRVIRRLLGQFEREAKKLPWERAQALGVSPYEAVVIASMVEREARVPKDRGKVARVIYNRLEAEMLLQIDATVQYALGRRKPNLTYEDLEVDSPYNTYLHTGLPPTPIASPGLASLKAALNPTEGNWLYFVVVDPSGRHAFTESYDEFLRLKDDAAA